MKKSAFFIFLKGFYPLMRIHSEKQGGTVMKKLYIATVVSGICLLTGMLGVSAKEHIGTSSGIVKQVDCPRTEEMHQRRFVDRTSITTTDTCVEGHPNCDGTHRRNCDEGHQNCDGSHNYRQEHHGNRHQRHHF